MRRKEGIILFLLGLVINLAAAFLQPVPGYMDAEYYYAGAVRIAGGDGFTEPFLWNYLDDPAGLPHPSHTYWMPLASLVASAGMLIGGSTSFTAGRAGFILLAACLGPLTGWLAGRITDGQPAQRFSVWFAGLTAVFPGLYLVYTTLTETFVLYMLLGTGFIVLAFQALSPKLGGDFSGKRWLGLGFIAGLLHLTRADGLLWLAAALLLWGVRWVAEMRRAKRWLWGGPLGAGLIVIGYGLVMGAWFARNAGVYGQIMPPGGSRALWLTNYDQTYHYPADEITFQAWLQSGWQAITRARLNALWMNLKNMLVVQGGVFLLPLITLGFWRVRRQRWAQFAGAMLLLTAGIMTFVFPFAGSRGGYLHSGAAFQPLLWALAPLGLIQLLDLGARKRNWSRKQARRVFGTGLIVISALLTVIIFGTRVLGVGSNEQVWRATWDQAAAIDADLDRLGIADSAIILVNNPPGFYAATGRPAIAIPNGSLEAVYRAAERYGAKYLVLEENSVAALRDLYPSPRSMDGLKYMGAVGAGYLFEVLPTW